MEKENFVYELPEMITYSKENILDEIGPIQACAPSPCPVMP